MSFEAMAWAVKQETANSGQKLVLLMLADYTNDDTGQCNPSHERLAAKCCMGVATLKRHIDALEGLGLLTKIPVFVESVQRPNQYVLHIPGSSNRADPQLKMSPTPSSNRATEPITLTSNRTNTESVSQDDGYFAEFWRFYPNKVNKVGARKAFKKLKVTEQMLARMIDALEEQKKSEQWRNPKYIPHAQTWLNQERWEDEVPGSGFDPAYEKLRLL